MHTYISKKKGLSISEWKPWDELKGVYQGAGGRKGKGKNDVILF